MESTVKISGGEMVNFKLTDVFQNKTYIYFKKSFNNGTVGYPLSTLPPDIFTRLPCNINSPPKYVTT